MVVWDDGGWRKGLSVVITRIRGVIEGLMGRGVSYLGSGVGGGKVKAGAAAERGSQTAT